MLYIDISGTQISAIDVVSFIEADIPIPKEANTITLREGLFPSSVCLILLKEHADLLTIEGTYSVILTASATDDSITIENLVFDRSYAIDPDKGFSDTTAVIVYLADKRLHFLNSDPTDTEFAYNLVTDALGEPDISSYDATDPDYFPYDPTTLDENDNPWTWIDDSPSDFGVLNDLWSNLPGAVSFPTTVSELEWPTVNPLDIRPENRNAWVVFVELIHSIGWGIYPTFDGNFTLEPIDSAFEAVSPLIPYDENRLLDSNFPYDQENTLSEFYRVVFQARNRNGRWYNHHPYVYKINATTSIEALAEYVPDTTGTLNNVAVTAVFHSSQDDISDLPQNSTDLQTIALYVTERFINARRLSVIDSLYSGFVPLTASPFCSTVTFSANEHGPLTQFDHIHTDVSSNSFPENNTGSEKRRVIRGQTVGSVASGVDFLIDNIIPLVGGIDPSNGNPATTIEVKNFFPTEYADNEWVDAFYSPGVDVDIDWENTKTASGSETFRLLRARIKGDVAADDTTAVVDNIVVLSGGLDPRSTPGDLAEELTVAKVTSEAYEDNEWVDLVYFADALSNPWEILITERYRAIYGTYYLTPATGYAGIKIVAILDSGLDPRDDPTDADEVVIVKLPTGTTFESGDYVWADYAPEIGTAEGDPVHWLARPKVSTEVHIRFARVYGAIITAATNQLSAGWGGGNVKFMDNDTGVLDSSPTAVDNAWIGVEFPENSQVTVDTSYDPPRIMHGTCDLVVWEEASPAPAAAARAAITSSILTRKMNNGSVFYR